MNHFPEIPAIKTGHLPPLEPAGYGSASYESPTFDIRTDLAVEETEKRREEGSSAFSGVTIEEQDECHGQIHITRVVIENDAGAQTLGKPMGTYITLDASLMDQNDGTSHREISRVLAAQLDQLILSHLPDALSCRKTSSQGDPDRSAPCILAVGLGNSDVTPDALGPRVLNNLLITRHLKTGQFQLPAFSTDSASVCGIVPGVMAQTGMETAEIVRALVEQIHPHIVIVIDALAARSVARLGTTIQLADTGIHPGSGVGNHRHSLTEESLGVPVIAIGVPTVVGAAAIVTDTLDALIDVLCRETDTERFADALRSMSADEKYALIRELLEPRFGPMFVTPKDIDETIKRLSFTISEGINIALFGEQTAAS